MNYLQKLYKKIPVQLRLWLKWLIFILCLIILVLTLKELNFRLLVSQEKPTHFYTTWYGFRAFHAEGEDPYGTAMQTRMLKSGSPFTETMDESDTYLKSPLYGIILYLPFLFIRDFVQAYSWWLTLLEIAAVFMAILSVSVIKKKLKKQPILILLSLLILAGSMSFWLTIAQGSVAILSFLILLGSLKALQNGGDELTGVLLSILTIFPFYGWISMIYIVIWSVRQRRMKVLWWLVGSVILFGFAIALLEPQWLLFYLRMWVRYFNSVEIHFIYPLLSSVLPGTFLLPGFITVVLAGMLLLEWVLARHKEFILFYWTFLVTLVIESVLTLNTGQENLLFLPAILAFILTLWGDRWKRRGRFVGYAMTLLCLLLPWGLDSLLGESGPIQDLLLVSVVAGILFLNLYWVRWWLTHNVVLWQSDGYSLEESG